MKVTTKLVKPETKSKHTLIVSKSLTVPAAFSNPF